MRIKHRIDFRFIALFMAVVMLLSSVRALAFILPVAEAAEGITIQDDALHFVIRHWHMAEDGDAIIQGEGENGQWDKEAKEFFVVTEGYIMPETNGNGYVCCVVSQDGNDTLMWIGSVEHSLYIDHFDAATGKLYLNIKRITDDVTGEIMEDYTGLSISSGHSAIEYDGDHIVITYDPYVHLAKAHVFYNPAGKKVRGISKDEWEAFANTDLKTDAKNEIDTTYAYTGVETGKIVTDDSGMVIQTEDALLACNVDPSTVQLTKFYSSVEGLHTDNTVIAVSEDGRTFTVDLEAWYNEGYAPQIGFALDASGSMAFALDTPKPIPVDEDLIRDNRISQVTSDPGSNWEDYFLTDEQLNKILNPHNTDNSALSASGYNYFVLSGSSYEPLGYWEGVLAPIVRMPFTKDGLTNADRDWLLNTITMEDAKKVHKATSEAWNSNTFDFSDDLPIDWIAGGDTANFKFDGINGLRVTNTNLSAAYMYSVKLDTTPTDGNFTISFTLQTQGSDPADSDNRLAQLLYIGPANGADVQDDGSGNNNYYALYRANGSSSNRLKGTQRTGADGYAVSNVNSIFNQNATITVTLVFENATSEGGTVSMYTDGKTDDDNYRISLKTPLPNDFCIVLNGVNDNYNGKEIWIDNFTVYDIAMSSEQVSSLDIVTDGAPGVATTKKGDILGSINLTQGNTTTKPTLHHTQAGWYHVSHAGEYFNHYQSIGTGKRFLGVAGSIGQNAVNPNGYTYSPTKDEPTRFYVDSDGNLCCFYGANTNATGLSFSYVYELEDGKYIRTEGLQRILGSFTNKLNQRSPSSKVSAVRFSSSTTNLPLDELVLLDWTNDPIEMANMLSLNYGGEGNESEGSATGYTTSYRSDKENGIKQYNYGLTGSTNTASGLQSYWENLHKYVEDENPHKYFIIFTDGANNGSEQDAIEYANLLKNEGYTIYAVALIADLTSNDYKVASDFLPKLVGKTGDSNSDAYLFFADDMTSLTDRFQEILDEIAIDLGSYTVSNYIDPRFDLVGKDGNVWKLTADGVVNVVDQATGNVTATYKLKEKPVEFPLAGETMFEARSPELKYDEKADMYYLEWIDQTIPTSPENADTMEVWNAEYQLRAKDDFIGGNAILTNGNYDEMNWVRSPDDKVYISSGTDDAKKTTGDDYPSKGFPRTVVNVTLLPINTNPLDGVIYMGEAIAPKQILTDIKDVYMTETYYLEYLKRFAYARYDVGQYHPELKEQMDRPLLDLLTEWLEIDNDEVAVKAFSVPYMYLPAVEWDEESGKIALDESGKAKTVYNNVGRVETNQRCIVGVLTYRWEQLDPTPTDKYDPIRDYVKTDTERIVYSLTVEFTPLRVGDSYELFYGTGSDDNGAAATISGYGMILGEEIRTTAEGYPILPIDGTADSDPITYANTGIFEKYLRIDDEHKADVQEDTRMDREKYINGNDSGTPDHRGDYALIDDEAYKWNKNFKPAVGNEELVYVDTTNDNYTSNANYPYGDAYLINDYGTDETPDYRTLKAVSTYTADVVSGEVIVELKLLYGELTELAEKAGWDKGSNSFTAQFDLTATRSFTDTDIVEEIKKQQGEEWEDYGENFIITFELTLTKGELTALETEAKNDEDGYVTVYAKAVQFKTTFGEEDTVWTTDPASGSTSQLLYEGLPIGTYEFTLDNVNNGLGTLSDAIHFATLEHEEKESGKFREAYSYFSLPVLRGLNSISETPTVKWNPNIRIRGSEITKTNISYFVAEAESVNKKATTFYLGTDTEDPVAHRGDVGTNYQDITRYTNDRLGIIRLSTGMTLLTIKEVSGKPNESFLYRITGTTLGGKKVDITVSVNGDISDADGRSTTIEILPGNYTVTELPDWSWKYDNKDTYGAEGETWTLYPNDLTKASTSLRYRDDDPVKEHKTVIYEHERNEKVWLGGENHLDNRFSR